jgi:aspartyl-tRNA(Asn)/glutamyl-tRNA(Gln) amidotransferase subunit C
MDIKHIAKLANIDLLPDEEASLSSQLSDTLKTIEVINELDTSKVSPTSQVTGQENITHPDKIEDSRVLPLSVVLGQAGRTHNGFIVVPAVFDET